MKVIISIPIETIDGKTALIKIIAELAGAIPTPNAVKTIHHPIITPITESEGTT